MRRSISASHPRAFCSSYPDTALVRTQEVIVGSYCRQKVTPTQGDQETINGGNGRECSTAGPAVHDKLLADLLENTV